MGRSKLVDVEGKDLVERFLRFHSHHFLLLSHYIPFLFSLHCIFPTRHLRSHPFPFLLRIPIARRLQPLRHRVRLRPVFHPPFPRNNSKLHLSRQRVPRKPVRVVPDGTDIRALEDCGSLLDSNVDFLSATIQNTDSTDYLQSSQAEDMHTLLSAVLTNHQTCSDGIQSSASSSIQSALLGPFENGTMLYSVSLALYKQGWVPGTSKGRWLTERNPLFSAIGSGRKADDRSHFTIPSRRGGKIREATSMRGRKLLQLGGGYVHVNQMAVVRQDGTGDFSTIGDAVAATT
ncbi:hypothetical protein RHGRI_010662 [Rhododendron griersonianum]|uniref:Pectinesterase inhibitor domain-containing protein n=1 Tax=Rhododendron griersonianum TaxID=479676 RepID=A0AAV6KKG1_9ERIC|nr:hypothetical protein RHGRI_010662 [Rhododendron griersonianum]